MVLFSLYIWEPQDCYVKVWYYSYITSTPSQINSANHQFSSASIKVICILQSPWSSFCHSLGSSFRKCCTSAGVKKRSLIQAELGRSACNPIPSPAASALCYGTLLFYAAGPHCYPGKIIFFCSRMSTLFTFGQLKNFLWSSGIWW